MKWIFEPVFGAKLRSETTRYLRDLTQVSANASRERAARVLKALAEVPHAIRIGETNWGGPVRLPAEELLNGNGLLSGTTGGGKTSFAILLFRLLLSCEMVVRSRAGLAVLDAKGDLFRGALYALKQVLDAGGPLAEALRERVLILDFGLKDPVSQYNILARWPGVDNDFFASSRADLIFDLLPGPDKLSLPGASVLRQLIALLSLSDLPLTWLSKVIHDEGLLRTLIQQCPDPAIADYFRDRFPATPRSTLAAIERRMDALFAAESVRLILGGTAAPDFRRLHEDGAVVLINVFGENLSRGVRRLLQAIVLSDIRHAVFARHDKTKPMLWLCDEAQNFFLTENLREQVNELLTMSRSFRAHFVFITQNLSVAVPDTRLLRSLHTNVRWTLNLRSEPGDAALLLPAMPVTGRKVKPQIDPFQPRSIYTPAEERSLALHSIISLPDRTGYLWLKAHSPEAFLIKTGDLDIPSGDALARAVQPLLADPKFGQRQSLKQHNELLAKRNCVTSRPEASDMSHALTRAYHRTRKGSASSDLNYSGPAPKC